MYFRAATTAVAGLTALLVLAGCEQSTEIEPEAASSEARLQITGAGSSFAKPIFNQWFALYGDQHPELALNYDSIGSGAGIERFLAGRVDIGATDAPLRSDEAAQLTDDYLQLPVTGGMIALAYNLPNVEGRSICRATSMPTSSSASSTAGMIRALPRPTRVSICPTRSFRWSPGTIQAAPPSPSPTILRRSARLGPRVRA